MRKTHHSCAVVITKQFRVSSRMSQSALALDHLRTCVLCGGMHTCDFCATASLRPYYEPGKWCDIYTL